MERFLCIFSKELVFIPNRIYYEATIFELLKKILIVDFDIELWIFVCETLFFFHKKPYKCYLSQAKCFLTKTMALVRIGNNIALPPMSEFFRM